MYVEYIELKSQTIYQLSNFAESDEEYHDRSNVQENYAQIIIVKEAVSNL